MTQVHPNEPDYPMCERWGERLLDRRAIQEFVEWLYAQGFSIQPIEAFQEGMNAQVKLLVNAWTTCFRDEGDDVPFDFEYTVAPALDKLLDTFHEIDQAKLEQERRAILEAQRKLNEKGSP